MRNAGRAMLPVRVNQSPMAYRFKIDEPPQKGVRRIAVRQIDGAVKRLTSDADRAVAVHESRRAIKRMRSLLRLIRPGLSRKAYAAENTAFRDIGRMLSQARDLDVVHETLTWLGQRHGADAASLLAPVAGHVAQRRTQSFAVLEADVVAEAIQRLEAARVRWSRIKLSPGTFATLGEGFEAAYRGGRACLREACVKTSDEAIHEWRKAVQRHRDHMQLLRPAWPEYCEARYAAAKLLSVWLGDDHDLALLKAFSATASDLELKRGQARAIAKLCEAEQERLRAAAWALGARLFADEPDGLARRMAIYWATASHIAREMAAGEPEEAG